MLIDFASPLEKTGSVYKKKIDKAIQCYIYHEEYCEVFLTKANIANASCTQEKHDLA